MRCLPLIPCTHSMAQGSRCLECLSHLIHGWSERFLWRPWSLHQPSSSFSHSSSTSSSSFYPSTSPRLRSKILCATSPRRWGQLTSPSPTQALQGHSRRSLIDPTLQDNVVIPSNFFQYIYHVACAINLHSIINSGLIPGGQILTNRQTVFFLPVDPMDKNHKDPGTIDLYSPRHAQYMHKAWKKHQNTVYWVDINLALKKGLKFYQTRSNAIIIHETLPAYCIPKVVRMETGEVMYEKVYASPRPPPKISLKHDWMKELGPKVAQRPDGQVVQQFKKFPINPTESKPRSW